jgi:hypothetical protein
MVNFVFENYSGRLVVAQQIEWQQKKSALRQPDLMYEKIASMTLRGGTYGDD